MEKGLLDESPAGIGDKDDEDFPVENSLQNGGPTGVAKGDNSADEKEDENGWDGDPEGDFYTAFERVVGLRFRRCCPDDVFCVRGCCQKAKEGETGQGNIEPRISTGEEQEECGHEECENPKLKSDFLAEGCEHRLHGVKVCSRANGRALKIMDRTIDGNDCKFRGVRSNTIAALQDWLAKYDMSGTF